MKLRYATLLAVVLASGCGGDGSDVVGGAPPTDATTSSAPAATSAQSTTPAPSTTGRPVTTAAPTTRRVDPYLQTGVIDQIFPPGTKAYELLATGACGPLLRQIERGEAPTTTPWQAGGVPDQLTALYTAAARACLSQWDTARTTFQKVTLPLKCGAEGGVLPAWSSSFQTEAQCQTARKRVYDWTSALLNAQKADPAFKPNFPTPPKT